MRRIATFFAAIAAVLLCLAAALPAAGAGRGKFALNTEATDLARGDAFTVILQCTRNPGVREMRLTLSYDRLALEVLEIEDLKLFPGGKIQQSKDGDVLTFREADRKTNFDSTGNVAKITFRVRKDAPFGASQISLSISERMMDIQDASGAVVPFDVREWSYELVCPHENVTREEILPASLSMEGLSRVTCSDCGESWDEIVKPEIISEDGNVRATVAAGLFAEGTSPGVAVEYIYGGAESDAVRSIFGERLIRAFRVRFFVSGGSVIRLGEVNIDLESEVALPEYVTLYAYENGYTDRVDAQIKGNTVSFPWRDCVLLLVSTPPEEEPEITEDEPIPQEAAVTTTRSPEEEKRHRDGIVLAISAGALIVTGVGIGILMRLSRKKY